jgi:hypothetical protein
VVGLAGRPLALGATAGRLLRLAGRALALGAAVSRGLAVLSSVVGPLGLADRPLALRASAGIRGAALSAAARFALLCPGGRLLRPVRLGAAVGVGERQGDLGLRLGLFALGRGSPARATGHG